MDTVVTTVLARCTAPAAEERCTVVTVARISLLRDPVITPLQDRGTTIPRALVLSPITVRRNIPF